MSSYVVFLQENYHKMLSKRYNYSNVHELIPKQQEPLEKRREFPIQTFDAEESFTPNQAVDIFLGSIHYIRRASLVFFRSILTDKSALLLLSVGYSLSTVLQLPTN